MFLLSHLILNLGIFYQKVWTQSGSIHNSRTFIFTPKKKMVLTIHNFVCVQVFVFFFHFLPLCFFFRIQYSLSNTPPLINAPHPANCNTSRVVQKGNICQK